MIEGVIGQVGQVLLVEHGWCAPFSAAATAFEDLTGVVDESRKTTLHCAGGVAQTRPQVTQERAGRLEGRSAEQD